MVKNSKKTTELAFAKINLCLAVTGRESNGYHTIDSVMCPLSLCDEVTVAVSGSNASTVVYEDGRVFERDVTKLAVDTICGKYGLPPVDVFVKKRIPVGAGLGGSSADAAAVARGLARLYGLERIDVQTLVKIGSDVPYMYEGGIKRVRGMGELAESVTLPYPVYGMVAAGNSGASTAKVYALYDKVGGEQGDIESFLKGESEPFNALERAAERLCPEITAYKDALKKAGFQRVFMTGSGNGVIGLTVKDDLNRAVSAARALLGGAAATHTFEFDKYGRGGTHAGLSGLPI